MSRLEELASALIALDTVSTKTNVAAAELLAERLDGAAFSVHLQRFDAEGVAKANVVAWAGPAAPDGLMLSGHIDTVPFEGQPGWSVDPLRLGIGDDRVTGRGTSDMKVFLAQCVEAAERIDHQKLARPVVFAFTADEEIGCLGAARLAPELGRSLGVPTPKLCWIGEPTSWRIHHAHKSYSIFDVSIRVRGGHSGLPALGVNAIAVAGRVIELLNGYQGELRARPSAEFASVFPDAPYTTVNLGTISGGAAANMIADSCVIRASVRGLPDVEPLEPVREIRRRLAELEAIDPASPEHRATIEITETLSVPPFFSPLGSPLEAALFERLNERPAGGALFGADACRFQMVGIDSLLCGPGDFDQAHQPDESISRRAFEEGTDVILSVVHRLCAR